MYAPRGDRRHLINRYNQGEIMKIMDRGIALSGVVCLYLFATQITNAATLTDNDIANMSMADKIQAQQYFRSHSFDFPKIFSAYHPGPYWILKKKSDFNLTDAQVKQEEALKLAMAKNTIEDETTLKQAYKTYAADSTQLNPSVAQITSDIEAIGKAQTSLAAEMVIYHLQGYALLDSNQQQIYKKLAAARTPGWFMSILGRICPAN